MGQAPAPDFADYVAGRGPALVRLAHGLTGDRHLAEDLVQEALARAHLRWQRIDNHDAYLRQGIVNGFLSWRRRRSSRELPYDGPALDGQTTDPSGQVVARIALSRAVLGLPPRQRAVVVLRYLEDRSDREIAQLLGCTESTVRTTAQKALQSLRQSHAALDLNGVTS